MTGPRPLLRRFAGLLPALLALAVALLVQGAAADDHAAQMEQVEGRVAGLASSIAASSEGVIAPPSFSVWLETDTGPVSVTLAPGARVLDAQGRPIGPTGIPLEARVCAVGELTAPGQFLAHELLLLP